MYDLKVADIGPAVRHVRFFIPSGGDGRALDFMFENAESLTDTIKVISTQIASLVRLSGAPNRCWTAKRVRFNRFPALPAWPVLAVARVGRAVTASTTLPGLSDMKSR